MKKKTDSGQLLVQFPIGKKTKRRAYSRLFMEVVEVESATGVLSTSIVEKSIIQSIGHEEGQRYDMSSEITDGLHTFNQDWEGGN